MAYGLSTYKKEPELLNKLILKFLSPNIPILKSFGKCLHILDIFRKSILQNEPTHPTRVPKQIRSNRHKEKEEAEIMIPSARELQERGITFKLSKSKSLKDVSFNGGILRIPSIIIDDCTETTLLNLIALERMHVGTGNEVSSFVFFVDNIIDNIIDVVQVSVHRYCRKPWNKWRANLIETYFRNPWAIVSLAAAIFLFALTIIQTVYTIIQFYNDAANSNNPSPPARPFVPRFPRPPHL